jgi:hypothetical protein
MPDLTHAFPALDPIPLPAPVWLFKILHGLTLTLHFAFLHMLIGGVILVFAWNLVGHLIGNKGAIGASGVVAKKLTVITTYVINLGVPPLLFAQVLYGPALYTSSALIGVWWFSVVGSILVAYTILYRMAHLADKGKSFWLWALVAMAPIGLVGKLFSTNMTLMLRPEVWLSMYAADPGGTTLPPHDPTMWPRFAFMMVASLALGAIGTSLWATKAGLLDETRTFLRRWSGAVAAISLPFLFVIGAWALNSQPEAVRKALAASAYAQNLTLGWIASAALSFLAGIGLVVTARSRSALLPVLGSAFALGAVTCWTLLRDIVRDTTLVLKGFDVWKSPEGTNWVVVILFIVSLVAGLGIMAWIGSIVRRATVLEEKNV